MPETIVTATRVATEATRVPAATTVITRAEIEGRGATTLAEALAGVPGLRVVEQGGPGQMARLFLRGTNSNQVLVLLDGVPVNDPSSPDGAFDAGQDLLADIERIEIIRGPFSTLYGSAAVGGAVNLVTRRATPGRRFEPFGEIAGGTQGTVRLAAGAGGSVGAFDYLGVVQGLSTRGFVTTAPRLATATGERDGFRGGAGTLRLGWALAEGARVEGLLRWRGNRFDFDRFGADDPDARGDDRRWLGQLRAEATMLDGALTSGIRIGRVEDRRRYVNLPDSGSPESRDDLYRGTRTFLDFGNRLRLPDAGRITDIVLAAGAGWQREEADGRAIADFGFGPSVSAIRASAEGGYAFGGVQARAFRRLDLSAALRHDAISGPYAATTWRSGAILDLDEAGLRIRAGIGTAFRAPTLDQRFGISAFVTGNPNLRPERSRGYDVGADLRVAEGLELSATWFDIRSDDLIAFQGGTYVNVARARSRGVEFEATLRLGRFGSVSGGWTITRAVDEATGERLLRRPEHLWSLSALLMPTERLTIAPTLLFTGRSRDFIVTDSGGYGGTGSIRSGLLFHLGASYRITEDVTLFADARNLGNSRFEPASGYVVPGRSVLVGARMRF
ncbi:MAG: TonB-dependent receptor [Acetobacteraceae bacterium]|nr:TonB-dependent receptor [Acetobacteraceae bacterium]